MSFSLWLVSDKNDQKEIPSIYQMPEEQAVGKLIEDNRLIEASQELLEIYPPLEELDDDIIDDSPWASSPEITAHWIHLAISFSKVEMVFENAGAIFEKYSLIGYDPQNYKIYG